MSLPDSANLPESAHQPGAAPRPTEQKQRLNVYTMMLVLSVIALTIAIWLLHLELERFYKDGESTDWPPWQTPSISSTWDGRPMDSEFVRTI
ncbi:MAG: hypothetical protein QGF59_05815 [Pirellulaceae bacterium]|nr:hypothetical protein [Pirellulaceae bacterium]